jgi:hypothetical protein
MIINPSGHGTPALTGAKSAPRVLAAKTGTDRTTRPKTTSTSTKEWAPIRGGLPKSGTARPRPPIISKQPARTRQGKTRP